ncbi:MAG TPA: PAS domain S-box protein, partial [Candidatus Nanoarchaeia archaeon]|nr:PAS domain S-box protein [Candidatus Nanoarchaeia archaeon]
MRSDKEYRELADSLPDIVFEADARGNLTFVNRRAFEITGYSREEFEKGINILQLIPAEDKQKVIENMRKALAGESYPPSEYRIIRKDGTIFDALV